uniref:Uncharacterized protein n=1 Tax=Trichobilharzia regenti TaxID=157069 RepID=A0AA85KA76_TRIRE
MAPRTTSLHTNSDVQTPSPTSFSFINSCVADAQINLGYGDILSQFVVSRDLFTILLINARSLINEVSELRTLLLVAKPTVALITESWCSSSVLDVHI